MNTNKENNREGKRKQEQTAADLDKMISEMEKRISEIEMEEMLSGYTAEELAEMGFIGDNSINMNK